VPAGYGSYQETVLKRRGGGGGRGGGCQTVGVQGGKTSICGCFVGNDVRGGLGLGITRSKNAGGCSSCSGGEWRQKEIKGGGGGEW